MLSSLRNKNKQRALTSMILLERQIMKTVKMLVCLYKKYKSSMKTIFKLRWK
jgi:hypothetical protein